MAQKGRQLNREVSCPLGCNEMIRGFDVRFHVAFQCTKRRIGCRFEGCKALFPIQDKDTHERLYCTIISRRNELVGTADDLNKMFPCALCSENVRVRDYDNHDTNECVHRIIRCPHSDCREEMQAHSLNEHLQYHCNSVAVKKRVWLIERARKRTNYPRPWGVEVEVEIKQDIYENSDPQEYSPPA